MSGRLLRVTYRGLCFGLDVDGDRVVGAAPVARWCVGKSVAWVSEYWRRRGATVEWVVL